MKVMYSPLISQASGSAGPLTASRWKGINFIRERVIPANPDTVDQQAQRKRLRQVVSWWHDVEQQIKDECNRLVLGMPLSGFNAFSKACIHAMYEDEPPPIMPPNAETNPVATLVATTGPASGKITLTWTLGDAAAANKVYILVGLSNVAEDEPDNLTLCQKETTAASALTLDATGLTPSAYYKCFLLVEEVASSKFSVARSDVAMAHA